MKKSFRGILAAVLTVALVALLAAPGLLSAQSGRYYYWFQMQDVQGEPYIDSIQAVTSQADRAVAGLLERWRAWAKERQS